MSGGAYSSQTSFARCSVRSRVRSRTRRLSRVSVTMRTASYLLALQKRQAPLLKFALATPD